MKQNKDTPVSGTTVKKKSLLNILLKIFGALFIAFLGFLLYILLTLNAGVATNLVDSYSPISPSIIYDIKEIKLILFQQKVEILFLLRIFH